MTALQVIPGEGTGTRAGRHGGLAAHLAVMWEASVADGYRLVALAESFADPRVRNRLSVMAAFCRAHANRLLERLAALGPGPLPVPPETREAHAAGLDGIREALALAVSRAARYAEMGEDALEAGDVRTHWVCSLHRAERKDEARELAGMAEALEKETGT